MLLNQIEKSIHSSELSPIEWSLNSFSFFLNWNVLLQTCNRQSGTLVTVHEKFIEFEVARIYCYITSGANYIWKHLIFP